MSQIDSVIGVGGNAMVEAPFDWNYGYTFHRRDKLLETTRTANKSLMARLKINKILFRTLVYDIAL